MSCSKIGFGFLINAYMSISIEDKRPSSSSMVDMPHSFDWIAMAWYLRLFSLVCFGIAATFEDWAVTFGFLGLLHVLYVFYRAQSVIHQDPKNP